VKEALSLWASGYQVSILNCVYSEALLEEDKKLIQHTNILLKPIVDLSKKDVTSAIYRLVKKGAMKARRYCNLELPQALGYGAGRYLRCCENEKADLYICHQELPTYIGYRLLNRGYKVAFDIEDWYSQDLLERDRVERPTGLLEKVERFAMKNAAYCSVTSEAVAKRISTEYSSKAPLFPIYNVFPLRNDLTVVDKSFTAPLQLFWFSQTIGPGRGLEQFIEKLNLIEPVVGLHLLGNVGEDYKSHLKNLICNRHQLSFHSTVPMSVLPEKIAKFDIGLALEMNTPVNTNLTVSNKYFQYLQAGLPVIVSATSGQIEVFDRFRPGILLEDDGMDLQRLNTFLQDMIGLKAYRKQAVAAAKVYCWENEEEKLLHMVKRSLAGSETG
jgi:glycosyltransferase involved in cell wall biosynthesis